MKNIVKLISLCAFVSILTACGSNYEDEAKAYAKSQMNDPDSVKWGTIKINNFIGSATGKKRQAVCGKFNAKNAFGGYVGMRRFFYVNADNGGPDFFFEDPSATYFKENWAEACNGVVL